MKKVLVIFLIIAAIGASVYFAFFNNKSDEYTFRYEKVSKGDITVMVTATGTLNAVTTVQVGAQVSGTIQKLYADFNSVVKEGQIIAQIDPTFLQQSVNDATANLERATAQYNEAKRNLDRIKSLFDKKLESSANYDAALTNYESTKSSMKQSDAQLERAKINLTYATIYAPCNGVVIDRKVDVGQTVQSSFSAPTLLTIANDLSKMQVIATIDESDIGKITIGQEATFTVDAYADQKFYGKVSQIRLAPVIIQNVVNYNVVIEVPNDELKLMPGMTASVRILVAKKTNVIKVPNIALRFQPPTELIDTVKMNQLREQFRGFGRGMSMEVSDTSRKNKNNQPQPNTNIPATMSQRSTGTENKNIRDIKNSGMSSDNRSQSGNQDRQFGGQSGQMGMSGQSGDRGGFNMSDGDREKFRKIRDSIMKAHGGNLSREDMMAEFQKVFKKGNPAPAIAKPPVTTPTSSSANAKFGVTQTYPQYQKSSVSLTESTSRGRIWILNDKGKLEPIFIRTGLNDGQFTEIISDTINEGQQIVIGALSNNNNAASTQTRNPLTGQGQQGGQGGMGRGR